MLGLGSRNEPLTGYAEDGQVEVLCLERSNGACNLLHLLQASLQHGTRCIESVWNLEVQVCEREDHMNEDKEAANFRGVSTKHCTKQAGKKAPSKQLTTQREEAKFILKVDQDTRKTQALSPEKL